MGKKAKTPKPSQNQTELENLQVAELRRSNREVAELKAFSAARNRFGRRSLIATSRAGTDGVRVQGRQNVKGANKFFSGTRQFDTKAELDAFNAQSSQPAPKPQKPRTNIFGTSLGRPDLAGNRPPNSLIRL